jgi:hypothetical protein
MWKSPPQRLHAPRSWDFARRCLRYERIRLKRPSNLTTFAQPFRLWRSLGCASTITKSVASKPAEAAVQAGAAIERIIVCVAAQ